MSSCLPLAPVVGLDESAEKGSGEAEDTGALGAGVVVFSAGRLFIVGVDGMDASAGGAALFAVAADVGGRSEFVSGANVAGALTETEPSGAVAGAPARAGVTG